MPSVLKTKLKIKARHRKLVFIKLFWKRKVGEIFHVGEKQNSSFGLRSENKRIILLLREIYYTSCAYLII